MLAGQNLTAELLNMEPTTYIPTLTGSTTSPTLGTGSSVSGWYYRIGRLVVGEAKIRFGSSGVVAGSGTYLISRPPGATPDSTFHTIGGGVGIQSTVGDAVLRDNSAVSSSRPAGLTLFDTDNFQMQSSGAGAVTDANPWVWAASDAISIRFAYIVVEP